MNSYIQWIIIPLLAAAIGWLTNKLAIKMLFEPIKPIKFLGLTIQGIFPKRQHIIAERIAEMVERNLFSTEDIKKQLFTQDTLLSVKTSINNKIDNYLTNDFKKEYPLISIFISDSKKEQFKTSLDNQLDQLLLELENQTDAYLSTHLQIKPLVEEKINALSAKEVNKLMTGILQTEFVFIEWIGAILGGIIGIIQVIISLLLK